MDSVSLPAADWTNREDLATLVTALGSHNMRWVGGAVRDTLLGLPVKDIDVATKLHPDTVMKNLAEADIRAIPTGIEHGTVTAVLPMGNVEITTLRKDVATDGRRATIAFAEEWRDDAARRDFTINAMFTHPVTLEISDYFDGLADLVIPRVRFIGDARERIREDHLRILRYYRFQARLGAAMDEAAEDACAQLAPMLKGLSRERIAMELLAILALPDPHATLARMQEKGVLPVILPEAGESGLASLENLLKAEEKQDAAPSAIRRLAALLPPDRHVAEQIAARLRLSGSQRKHLMRLATRSSVPDDPHALAYREGMIIARDLLLLKSLSSDLIESWQIPEFPLKGGEIVAREVGAGPEVARILRMVEDRWIAEGFPDRNRVAQMLDDALKP